MNARQSKTLRTLDPAGTEISWRRKSKNPERQRELKKEAVLKAAAAEFLARGYHETTIDDIARRLNVSKPSIYAYVDNKELILVECTKLGYERLDRLLKSVAEEEGTALDQLRSLFRGYAEYAMDEFGRCGITLADRAQVKENIEFIRNERADIQLRIKRCVAAGMEDGFIRPGKAAYISEILVSTFNILPSWFRPSGENSLREVADQLLDLIFFGIASEEVASARRKSQRSKPR